MNKQALVSRIKTNFPQELQALEQWVCYRIENREGKPTKIPYTTTGSMAKSDNPTTWASFDAVCKAFLNGNYNGVGFVFSEYDPYIGIDFDKCVDDMGLVCDPAKRIYIDRIYSYTERSQSGTGIHIIAQGLLPPGGRKSNTHQVEMYDNRRFFVVTGDALPGFPGRAEDRQQEIEELHRTLFPAKSQESQHRTNGNGSIPADDQSLLDRMFASRNGADIQALWLGNTGPYNGDESAADLALCNHLAFWTGNDAGRMDRLFRQSRLYREHKWGRNARTGETYGEGTIARAIAITKETYSPTIHLNGNSSHRETKQTTDEREYAKDAEAGPAMPNDDSYLLSQGAHDEGNAQCVFLRYRNRFAYNDEYGWLYYDGKKWIRSGAEQALVRAIVETLQARVSAVIKSDRVEEYKNIASRAIPTKNNVMAAKGLVESLFIVQQEQFETSPDLLNCANGTVNLKTGAIHKHTPTDYLMHCSSVKYDPDADQSFWLDFIENAVGKETADWLQVATGYSLTGHTRDEVLFYLYGPPRSGKGTFTEAILALLGKPLSDVIGFSTLISPREADTQNFNLAPLHSARFVSASETNAYERFNEAKVKMVTGGDSIQCAFKHKTPFSYRPKYKIWLSSNQPINADPDDDAVWGRVRLVHFPNSHLGEEDTIYKERMRSPEVLQGILAWAIQGAIRWYSLNGKRMAEVQSNAALKNEQRAELDHLAAWISENCILKADIFTPSSDLYTNYADWCKSNGVTAKQQKAFSQSLKHRGLVDKLAKHQGKPKRGFVGIGLVTGNM